MVNLKYFKFFEKEIYLKELENSYKEKSCDIKINEPDSEEYWDSDKKSEEEKIKEIVDKIDPIFKKVKEYYSKYFNSEYFISKIKEKFEKSKKSWDSPNLKSLMDFLNSITYLTYPPLEWPKGKSYYAVAWVSPDKNSVINYNLDRIGYIELEKWEYDIYRTTIHEMRHCIDEYFSQQGIDIVPGKEDRLSTLYLKRKKGGELNPEEIKELTSAEEESNKIKSTEEWEKKMYIPSTMENSARIQELKSFLEVDDFISPENLKKLLEDKLRAYQSAKKVDYKGSSPEELGLDEYDGKYYKALEDNYPLEIDFKGEGILNIKLKEKGDILCIYFKFNKEGKEIKDENNTVKKLFMNFLDDGEENEIKINLNKLYNHSLEFAKNDSNKEENREQRA